MLLSIPQLPLISVIVPIYNAEKWLVKCIKNIQASTYQNLEIILVDDGSSDESGQICDDYAKQDARIKVVHKVNGGAMSARNAGLDIISGDYLAFIDSDDTISEKYFELLIEALIKTNADMAVCSYKVIYTGYDRFRSVPKSGFLSQTDLVDNFIDNFQKYIIVFSPLWNKLIKKELFEDITKGLDGKKTQKRIWHFKEDIETFDDMFTNAKLIERCKNGVVFVNHPLYSYDYDINQSSVSKNATLNDHNIALVAFCNVFSHIIPSRQSDIKNIYSYRLSFNKFYAVHCLIINKQAQINTKLNWLDILNVLRLSNSFEERIGVCLIYFLPKILYRICFRFHSKLTSFGLLNE